MTGQPDREQSPATAAAADAAPRGYELCVDGAGVFRLLPGHPVTIGSPDPAFRGAGEHVGIRANLSRRQARLIRSGDRFVLETGGRGDAPAQRRLLGDREDLAFGPVRLAFAQPSPLSPTAVLSLGGSHSWADPCDGVVLFDRNCILGAGEGVHIRSHQLEGRLVVFWRDGLKVKADRPLVREGDELAPGSVLGLAGDTDLEMDSCRIRVSPL